MKNKNIGNIIGFTFSIIAAIIIVVIYIFVFNKDKVNDNMEDKDNDKDKEEIKETYKLEVYKDDNGSYYCKEKSSYCNTLAFTIDAKNKDSRIIAFDNNYSYVLYDDNGLFIYDVNNKTKKSISLGNNYQYYRFISNKSNVFGLVYSNSISNNVGYYDIKKDIKMYDDEYNNIYIVNDSYLGASSSEGNVLLDINSERVIEEYPTNLDNLSIEEVEYNSKKYYVLNPNIGDGSSYIIYDNNKDMITTNLSYFNHNIYNGYLYVSYKNKVTKYDIDGNIVNTINLSNIEQVINNYVIYIKDDYLNIMNNENKEIVKLDNKYDYSTMSRYYTKEELNQSGNNDKEEGYYIQLFYKDGEDSNGNYGIEYCYTKDKELKMYYIDHMEGGMAKPVLYLYPTKEEKITVKFSKPELLLTTYPKYKDKWEVMVSPNGDIKDKDNKNYYALYWDEKRYYEVDFKEGFYVTSEDAINFLEEKLTLIGLNDRERNEFIMYWLPILENNKKSLVYFELTKERELNNKLIINPKPDSMLRIAIHIKKVDNKVDIKEQKLETFNRYGFSAIEWGGMTY